MFDLNRYAPLLQSLHHHVCPRQILGLRMAEWAGEWLGLALPQSGKRLLAFVEMDGCFSDGVMAASGCSMGHRTMRLMDEGKIAVTFADTFTGRAVRVRPRDGLRARAAALYPEAPSRWHAQFEAYQRLPVEALLQADEVALALDLKALISRNGLRTTCASCGEEITNQREHLVDGRTLCRTCAGETYYAYPALLNARVDARSAQPRLAPGPEVLE